MQVFQSLTKGIRFDKGRFQDDFKLFNPSSSSSSSSLTSKQSLQPNENTSSNEVSRSQKRKFDDRESEKEESISDTELLELSSHSHLTYLKDVRAFRKLNQIKVDGKDVPPPATSFYEIFHSTHFPPYAPDAIKKAGYLVPTPIQLQSIPILLNQKDLLSCAPTGSGKTLAYLLPLLQLLDKPQVGGVRAIILAPTKDLAQQIEREWRKLVSKKWKSVVFHNEAQCNEHTHCDLLISTPFRLSSSVNNQRMNLDKVKVIILDECDRLLEKPGEEYIQTILNACPSERLIGMFSATIPGDIEQFAKSILKPNFIRVIVGHKNTVTTNIHQSLIFVGDEPGKRSTLRQQLLSGELKAPILIFVQNVVRARSLFEEFRDFPIDYIHAERSDHQRKEAIKKFRSGNRFILIGTDVVARGMDLIVNTVINFDFPTSTETYIHRIGRTGRAGREGKAITYFTVDDGKYLRCVVNIMKESGCEVPDWLLSLKSPSHKERKLLKYAPPKRKKFYVAPKSLEESSITNDGNNDKNSPS